MSTKGKDKLLRFPGSRRRRRRGRANRDDVPAALKIFFVFEAMLLFGLLGMGVERQRHPSYQAAAGPDQWYPKSSQEQALKKQLRPASKDLAAEMYFVARSYDQAIVPFAHYYVATRDITLPESRPHGRAFSPLVIFLPKGIRWVAGPRLDIVLITEGGHVIVNPLCRTELSTNKPLVSESACADEVNPPPARTEMMRNLRPISSEEALDRANFFRLPDDRRPYQGRIILDGVEFYESTGDLRVWPGAPGSRVFIILRPGDKVVGGILGRTVVVEKRALRSEDKQIFGAVDYQACADYIGGAARTNMAAECRSY